MIFNIYYINFPKVYEIKMMLSNIISKAKEVTQGTDCESQEEIKAKFGISFLISLIQVLKELARQKVLIPKKSWKHSKSKRLNPSS